MDLRWEDVDLGNSPVAVTVIDSTTGTDDAAAVLGHSGTAVTSKHYVQRAHVAPDVSAALEALGQDAVDGAGRAGETVARNGQQKRPGLA